MSATGRSPTSRQRRWWYLLLLVPFIVLSAVPMFNRVEPRVFGIPFFWWFQLLWIPVSAAITALVYDMAERGSDEGDVG